MTSNMAAPVVVGTDGSEVALQAVRAAAREAAERGCPLRIVHAFIWPLMRVPLGPAPARPPTPACATRRGSTSTRRWPRPTRWRRR